MLAPISYEEDLKKTILGRKIDHKSRPVALFKSLR